MYPLRFKLHYNSFHATVLNVRILLDLLAADAICIYTVMCMNVKTSSSIVVLSSSQI